MVHVRCAVYTDRVSWAWVSMAGRSKEPYSPVKWISAFEFEAVVRLDNIPD
jgi:hypothetical protein